MQKTKGDRTQKHMNITKINNYKKLSSTSMMEHKTEHNYTPRNSPWKKINKNIQ